MRKLLKDYTAEQLWKLERRLMMQDIKRNPESTKIAAALIANAIDAGKARKEAEHFKQASEEMGAAEFADWCALNPLRYRAQLHLSMIEQELSAPAVKHGLKFPSGKPKGSLSKRTQHIHKLATDHPDASAKEIFAMADKSIVVEPYTKSFDNVVSTGRKLQKKRFFTV